MWILVSVPVMLVGAAMTLALRENRAAAAVAITSQLVGTLLVLASVFPVLRHGGTIALTWDWPRPIERIDVRIDALSAFFLSWSLPMTLLGTIYAVAYLQPYLHRGRHLGPHLALLNITSIAFVLIYSVQNALVFLLGWEIAAVAAWLLVIWDYPNQKIRFAGFNYLVSTHIGLFVLVAAFMLLHSATGSMCFAEFGTFLSRPSPMRGTIFVLLGLSFALKSAFFPFHTWLPRAHSAAPAHVSALMSGVIHKAGLFAFLRFTLLMGRPEEWMGWTVLGFGALSAFGGVLYTTTQRDLKRMLGYSSTENVGIAAMGFGVGYLGWTWNVPSIALLGFAGGLLHLLNHALFKCLLFYAAGCVHHATHTVDLERLGGLARRLPRTTVLFLLGGLAMGGLPPFNAFASEFLIYAGLFSGRTPSSASGIAWVAAGALLAFVGAVSALSITRAFGVGFLGQAREPNLHIGEDAPAPMCVPMLVHAVGCIVLGLAPQLGVASLATTLALFPISGGGASVLQPLGTVAWINRALAAVLLTAGIATMYASRRARRSATWGCGYNAATPRMQYTASAFSEHFARLLASFMPALRRERLPVEPFPQHASHLSTHHADAVERRLFEVLGRGEDFAAQAAERIPDQPRFAFAAALVVLLLIGAILLGTGPR